MVYGTCSHDQIRRMLMVHALCMAMSLDASVFAQTGRGDDSDDASSLTMDISMNNYIFRDDYIFNPIVAADRGELHLEGRYNYEDLNTLSLFAGYNIRVTGKWGWDITPMFGVAFGETNGVIPALETTLSYGAFEWYIETEYLLITDEGDENFFYTWSELNYFPQEWLSLGIIGTRTRLFETGLDVQYGLSLGYHDDAYSIMASFMNFGEGDPYFYLSVGMRFE